MVSETFKCKISDITTSRDKKQEWGRKKEGCKMITIAS